MSVPPEPEPDGVAVTPAPNRPPSGDAAARVRAILDSPSYRQADEDVDFLNSADARGVRLQVDYLKAELILRGFGVRGTIAVFGSNRIPAPGEGKRRIATLRAACRQAPEDQGLQDELARAERLAAKSRYYSVAREFGRLVGACGGCRDNRILLMTGGGPGLMEAANRGAFEVGANSIGLNIALPHEQLPNAYITPELCLQFHYFSIRKLHFLLRVRALVVFPGGFGTFDELFETLTLVQTGKIRPIPIVLVGRDYWHRAFDLDFLVAEAVVAERDRNFIQYAESARAIWSGINEWYQARGETLLPEP